MTDGDTPGRVGEGGPAGAACHLCGKTPRDPVLPWKQRPAVCRSCFIAWDDRQLALEVLACVVPAFAPDPTGAFLELEARRAAGVEPRYRKRAPDLIGSTFGRFTVEGMEYRARQDGHLERFWILRCECGERVLVRTSDFKKPGRRDGKECGACTRKRRGLERAKRIGGFTIRELALAAQVSENAVRQRIRLGWPVELLAASSSHTPFTRSVAA